MTFFGFWWWWGLFMIGVNTPPRGTPRSKTWRANRRQRSPIGPLFPWFRGGREGGDLWQISLFPLFWHICVCPHTSRGASSRHLFCIWPCFLIWVIIDTSFHCNNALCNKCHVNIVFVIGSNSIISISSRSILNWIFCGSSVVYRNLFIANSIRVKQ